MKRSPEEEAQRQRYEALYPRAQSSVMLSIERHVCGCDYGATSWTTRVQALQIAELLALRPGLRLLEVGAGSGWPGLYLAKISGCDIALVDLPTSGLRIAAERAAKDCAAGACWIAVAHAAMLPFSDGSFDAVSHSDLLCCLKQKRATLKACRGAVRKEGRMVFTVFSISPGLSPDKYRHAVEIGPEFIESEADYPTLLGQTGWVVVDHRDVSQEFTSACRRQLQADEEHKGTLRTLIGSSEYAERQADWISKLKITEDGLMRRELFVATPDRP